MLAPMPEPRIQFADANGKPLAGGFVYTCLPAGSITDLKASYQDAAGTMLNSNPVVLDSAGRATIFLNGFYHIFVEDSLNVAVYDVDNVSSQSFFSTVTVQWQLYDAVATYVSGTSFTIPGNVVSDFPIGLRLKAIVTAGTIYGTVSNSAAGGGPVVTTVTVIWDSGALDAGLSAIYTGIITPNNTSLPIVPVVAKNGTFVYTVADLNRFIVGTNTIAMNFTLPTTAPSGSITRIHNSGTANITLVGTVNGTASPVLTPNSEATLFFDGSAWYGIFYDAANGTFTTSLKVGSQGGFPAFQVDNTGDVTVTGGTDTIWNLIHGSTAVVQVDASANLTILTRGFLTTEPLTDKEMADKKYVDDTITAAIGGLSAEATLDGLQLVPHPYISAGGIADSNWEDANLLAISPFSGYYTLGSSAGLNPGGYFHNVFVSKACNAYFHFYDVFVTGDYSPLAIQYGWRIGYATSQAIGGYASTLSPFPLGHRPSPTSFSTTFVKAGAGAFTDFFDHEVIGPVALTPGWYSFFVQLFLNDTGSISLFRIYGGLYMTLSVS